eukprot:151130_1
MSLTDDSSMFKPRKFRKEERIQRPNLFQSPYKPTQKIVTKNVKAKNNILRRHSLGYVNPLKLEGFQNNTGLTPLVICPSNTDQFHHKTLNENCYKYKFREIWFKPVNKHQSQNNEKQSIIYDKNKRKTVNNNFDIHCIPQLHNVCAMPDTNKNRVFHSVYFEVNKKDKTNRINEIMGKWNDNISDRKTIFDTYNGKYSVSNNVADIFNSSFDETTQRLK